jgi:molybdate transport system ATP-binding protein
VLVEGRLRQLGAPAELLGAPADPFVAEFAGANVLEGVAESGPDGLTRFHLDGERIVYSTDEARGRAALVVYPWDVSLARRAAEDSALNHLEGEIVSLVQVGNRVRVRLPFLTAEITASSAERLALRPREVVFASFKATQARLLPAD